MATRPEADAGIAAARLTADRGVTLCYDRHMSIVAEGEGEIDRFVAGTGNCLFGGGDPTAVAERRMARAGHIDAKAVRRGAGDGRRPVGGGAMGGAVRLAPDACETTQAAPFAQAGQEADAPHSAANDRTVQLFDMDGSRERPAEGDGAVTRCGAGNPGAAILDADLPVGGNPPEREARVAGGAFSVGWAATALDAEWAGRAAPWTGTRTRTRTGP